MNAVEQLVHGRQVVEGSSKAGYNEVQSRAFCINAVFIVFITIVMGIRMYARLVIVKAVGFDDVMMLIGAMTTIGLSIGTIIAVQHGVGKLIAEIAMDDWEPMLLSIWTTRLLYSSAMMFVKLALLSLYLRLDNRPTMRWTVYVLMFFVVGLTVAGIIVSIVGCYPPEVFWRAMEDPERYISNCIDPVVQQTFWDAAGVIVILTDVCIWACPLPMVWKLHLPKRQKWAVSGVFALGIFSVAAGCVRFYYVRRLANETEMYFYLADSLNWCAMELYVAIFCGCSSALKVFLKKHFPTILGSSSGGKYQLGSHGLGGGSHPLSSLSGHHGPHKTTCSSNGRGHVGMETHAVSRNDSEEAIIPQNQGIVMKREIQQEVTRHSSESDEKSQHAGTRRRSRVR